MRYSRKKGGARKNAVPGPELKPESQRDGHLDMTHKQGRLAWQTATGYGRRALVETTMGRYKSIIGLCLQARQFDAQQTEVAIGVAVLNRMLAAGRPHSVRSNRNAPKRVGLGNFCLSLLSAPTPICVKFDNEFKSSGILPI